MNRTGHISPQSPAVHRTGRSAKLPGGLCRSTAAGAGDYHENTFPEPLAARRGAGDEAKTIVVGFRPLAASRSVKQLRRGASVSKPPDAQSNPPGVAFAVQMRPGHFVCGFARISGRHEPRVLLLPAATAAKLDLVYVHPVELGLVASLGRPGGRRADAFLLGTRSAGRRIPARHRPSLHQRADQVVALANRHAVPAIYPFREDVVAGGLVSYGASNSDAYRLVGGYAGHILSGKKPADLPVQQVTRLEMIINIKTATALGLAIPLPLLARADEVVE
jgi:hypothetical protein